jgi:hypothetical protein
MKESLSYPVNAFSHDGMAALQKCQHFRGQVLDLDRQWCEEQKQRRDEFETWVSRDETHLRRLDPAVKLRPLYDPQEPAKSLAFVCDDVLTVLRTWLLKQERTASDLLIAASNSERGDGATGAEVLAQA